MRNTKNEFRKRLTETQARKRDQDRMGIAIIVLCALSLAFMFYGAYQVDKANEVSISQSPHNNGI